MIIKKCIKWILWCGDNKEQKKQNCLIQLISLSNHNVQKCKLYLKPLFCHRESNYFCQLFKNTAQQAERKLFHLLIIFSPKYKAGII